MISARYASATAALLTVALVPTVIHSYRGLTIDDGLRTAAIPGTLAGMQGEPTPRRPGWARDTLGADDFIERVYRADREEAQLLVVRSYDPKRLYHHPELAVLRGLTTQPAGGSTLPGRPDVPVHLLGISRGTRKGVAAYVLLYDGRYVERPILFQLRTSAELLLSGRRAMTLFFASDFSGSLEQLAAAPSVRLLEAAVEAWETQPR